MPKKELTLEDLRKEPSDEVKAKAKTMITRQRIQLLCSTSKSPFFAHLAMQLVLREEVRCNTMATNGNYLFYNPNWVVSLADEELCAVICHDAMHPALGHLWRVGLRDEKKWNYATDFVINGILDHNHFVLPNKEHICLDHKYDNLSAEDVYAQLPDPPKITVSISIGEGGFGSGQQVPGEDEIGTLDNHDYWKDAGSKQDGHGEIIENNEQVWKERLARAAMAAKMQGKLPSDIEQLVDATVEPKLPWREILRNFIQDAQKTDFRMMPPSKKYLSLPTPLYMPSMKGEFLEIAVAIDTSGSISDPELEAFVSEIQGIADQFESYRIHVYACDARVHGYDVVETHDEWPKKYKGRGGTDFRPVFKDIEEKGLSISALVYLTDSLGSFPDAPPSYPTIWVVDRPNANIPFGEQVFLDLNDKN